MTENETYDELGQYDQSYSPKKSGQRPGIDLLTNGDHDFRILGAELRRTPKQQELILGMELRVESGLSAGQVVEHVYFFRNQDGVDRLGGDLCTLGIEADSWNGRFSRELPGCLRRLTGVRFRGKKTSYKKLDGTLGANLWINARLPDAPMGAVPSPVPEPASMFGGNGNDDIPF
jgi:hypothetical protein